MKKIKLILTGGTIGAQRKQDTLSVAPQSPLSSLYRRYPRRLTVDFDVSSPLSLLSENMHFGAWQILHEEIKASADKDYAGIIVTHGTDTLAYTMAAQSFLLQNPSIPIVFVASNKILTDKSGNGFHNFCCAVKFILQQATPGFFTIFRNTDKKTMVHLGTRLKQLQPFSKGFESACPYGEMTQRGLVPLHMPKLPLTPFPLKPVFSDEILPLRTLPNLNYRFIQLSPKLLAVLHELYHSGTADVMGQHTSLLHFAHRCKAMGIPLFCAPAGRPPYYETTDALLKAGVLLLAHMTFEACYVKLSLALAQLPPKDIFSFMQNTNLAHERLDDEYEINGK